MVTDSYGSPGQLTPGYDDNAPQETPAAATAAPRLERMVVIPQSHQNVGSPFARAYSPALASHGISMEEFVSFVDKLNTVTAGSPPFQYLTAAGEILGYLPIPHVGWIGAGIEAGGETGQIATSLLRERSFLKRANAELFAPRGLTVKVMKGKLLKAKLGFSKDESIMAPIEQSMAEDMSLHERRLAGMRHLVAPLTFDVPPPSAEHKNLLDRMNASAQKRRLQRQEDKVTKYRERYSEAAEEHRGRLERKEDKYTRRLAELQGRITKYEEKRQQRLEKLHGEDMSEERRRRKLGEVNDEIDYEIKYVNKDIKYLQEQHEQEVSGMAQELQEEDRERKIGEQAYWLVVQNL